MSILTKKGRGLKNFWKDNGQKTSTVIALVLIAVVGFRSGQIYEKDNQPTKINVSLNQLASANPHQEKIKTLGEAMERKGINFTEGNSGNAFNDKKECALVGSKNSNKYHQPSCRQAKNIKSENLVCFVSKEDAIAKGYQPAKCCH